MPLDSTRLGSARAEERQVTTNCLRTSCRHGCERESFVFSARQSIQSETEHCANRKMSRIRNRFWQVLQSEGKGNRFCLSLAVQSSPIGSSERANRWTALVSCVQNNPDWLWWWSVQFHDEKQSIRMTSSFKTITEWIQSNGWPIRFTEHLAVKDFHQTDDHAQQQSFTHRQIASLADQVKRRSLLTMISPILA